MVEVEIGIGGVSVIVYNVVNISDLATKLVP